MTEINQSIYDIVPSVAYAVHRQFNKWVERDDVKQECLQWALIRTDYINSQLSEPDTEQRRHNEQKIAWQMSRAAERYCRKEKATKSGYQLGDEAFYQSAIVAQLLPFVIASSLDGTVLEQAQEMIRDGQPKGSSSPAEGGNLLAMLLDIKHGFEELGAEDKRVLTLRYHENFTLEQIGGVLGCHTSTADRRCNSALRKLINELGGQTPWGQ